MFYCKPRWHNSDLAHIIFTNRTESLDSVGGLNGHHGPSLGQALGRRFGRGGGLQSWATPMSVEVTWSMLGLREATVAAVRDLWAHADRGDHVGSYTCAAVAPHDVCALRVTPHGRHQ
eukprot:SAG11_NODE_10217_length_846_cov_1.491299_1_plen_118_part_00